MHYTKIDFLIVIISIITIHTVILTNVAVFLQTHFNSNILETTLAKKPKFFAIGAKVFSK